MDQDFDECGPEDRSVSRPLKIYIQHRPYFSELLKNSPESVTLLQESNIPPDFEPGMCHCNVQRWVNANPGYCAVPGWLYGPSVTRPEDVFMAHSVVQHPGAATLIDVTPFPGQSRLVRLNFRFFRHLGSVALYRSLKALYVDVSL
jgi:hypothetical protein